MTELPRPKPVRRTYYMHSAHETVGVSVAPSAWPPSEPLLATSPERCDVLLDVCLLAGLPDGDADGPWGILEQFLEQTDGVRLHRQLLPSPPDAAEWQGFVPCDCLILTATAIPDGLLPAIERHLDRGGGVVGVRSGAGASRTWRAIEHSLFGGACSGACHVAAADVTIAPAATDHTLLVDFQPFVASGTLPTYARLADDATVLLTASHDGQTDPVAWTRVVRGSRVFYTSLGDASAFCRDGSLDLLRRAVFWTTG